MKDIKKYPFNPAYYKAHNDICKRRDTKRLYFSPLRIDLPHGRGAGATSFCAIEALLAVEKSVVENQKPQKPKKRLPYHVAEQNDTSKLRNVLFICPGHEYVEFALGYFRWALEKLNLAKSYTITRSDATITREETRNQIRIVTADRMKLERVPLREFSFFIIDEATMLSKERFASIRDWLCSLVTGQNKILLVSYNPNFADDWLRENRFNRIGDVNYRCYHADFRTMPKAWLGKCFFIQADILKKENLRAYSEEYLGLPYKEPDKNVPHGTFRGERKNGK